MNTSDPKLLPVLKAAYQQGLLDTSKGGFPQGRDHHFDKLGPDAPLNDRMQVRNAYERGCDRYQKMERQIAELLAIRGESKESFLAGLVDRAYYRQPCKETPANGTRACLLKSGDDFFLRVQAFLRGKNCLLESQ
jgi:hypothetical protein